MKLTWLLITIVTIQATASSVWSQSTKMTVNLQEATLNELFLKIENNSKYRFFYNNDEINIFDKVSVIAKDKSIGDILTIAFAHLPYTFKELESRLILVELSDEKTKLDNQQQNVVSGKIIDKNGEPLVGVTVVVKGTTRGTVSDIDGMYSLKNVPMDATLQFSFIGMKRHEVPVAGKTLIDVVMEEKTIDVDEVVVVGYGFQKKVNLTGAVTSINAKKLENKPIANVSEGLQGIAPGLIVTSSSGRPGEIPNIKIRGISSLNSGGVLILIDGIEGNINDLNPDDIENISILKDASSTAIYGSRAAEGVILITTKTGETGKVKITYNNNIAIKSPSRLPESNDALTHVELANTAFQNANLAPLFTEEYIEAIKNPKIIALPISNNTDWMYTSDFDWIDYMIKESFQQNHSISISEAKKNTKYLISGSWLDQDGMFSEYGPDNYDKYNLRCNVTTDLIEDKLTLSSKLQTISTRKKSESVFGGWNLPYIIMVQCGPNMPIYDPNGNYSRFRLQTNPIQVLKEAGFNEIKYNKNNIILSLDYKPIQYLTFKAIGGINRTNYNKTIWNREYAKYGPEGVVTMAAGQRGPNYVKEETSSTVYKTGQLLGYFDKEIKKHSVNAMLGTSVEINEYESLFGSRTNIIGNELPALNLGSSDTWKNSANANEWRLLSFFGRLNYAFDERFLFECNIRADGSSKFSENNKWGYFPSTSVAWRMIEENFMKKQDVFSNLKIKMSYGQVGNQTGLGLYDHIPQYNIGGYYPFSDGSLSQWGVQNNLPSQARTWETIIMQNIGFEMGFFSNALNVEANVFKKRNKDMLVSIEIPSIIGINVPTGNYGELEVKGWELDVSYNNNINDFHYTIGFNIYDQTDKITSLAKEYSDPVAGVKNIQGYPLNTIFGYQSDGYFNNELELEKSAFQHNNTGIGDIKYIDQNEDGVISAPYDLVKIGSTTPRFVYGFTLNGQYKNFDFQLLFQGVGKRDYYLNRQAMQAFPDTWSNYSFTYMNDYWSENNQDAAYPRPYAGSSHNYVWSDKWVQNAAYCRLKNLQLGYTFNDLLSCIDRLKIYFSGQNLLTFTKFHEAFDPEITSQGGAMYPISKVYSLGLNITF